MLRLDTNHIKFFAQFLALQISSQSQQANTTKKKSSRKTDMMYIHLN